MIPQENKLLDLMSNNEVTFFIPPYQRNYEWTDEQCKIFMDDVIKTCSRNITGKLEEHFFGSITFFKDETPFGQPNKLVLIDGQQRVTTSMLFLVALRDLIENDALKKFIDCRYLKNNNVEGENEYKIKLKQVETDWIAYRNIILSEPLTEKEKDSAVFRNYKYFINKLSEYREEGNDLGNLIDKGLCKFSVITIELQPNKNEWENPQEIFESMNSLGKPLSLADLVRNYLLLGLDADTQTNLYNKYWMKIEKLLPHKVSDFIRDYMQGLAERPYPKASEHNHKLLYGVFKKIFEGQDSTALLKDLSEYAHTYSYVVAEVSSGSKMIDAELKDLRKINVTTAYSFLMMLMRAWEKNSFTEKEVTDILCAFRIYCYRRRILTITSAENKGFPALVTRIPELIEASDKKTKTFEILSQQENNLRLPNDIELTRFIETMNFYNFNYCKFYLSLVEEALTKSRPDINDKALQIEHIMPQKLNEEWINALGEDYELIHQENVHNIGNLTLIRHNQELGQKSFEKKKEVYENNAGLQIARTQITNNDVWNQETIKKRAGWIIEFMLKKVLPIPDKMRKTNNFKPKEGRHLSFQELQLIGLDITFVLDPSFTAHVVSDNEVEFEGKKWRLSPLTKEIQIRRGVVNQSGTYSGAQFWSFDGIRLSDII